VPLIPVSHAGLRDRLASALPAAQTEEMMRVALVICLVIVLVLVLVWGLQRRLIYFPSGSVDSPARVGLYSAQDVVLEPSDGLKLRGWFIPAAGANRRMAVLVANGNAGNRSGRAALARALSERGLAVLLFDYRGYGGNPGRPSERGLARDVRAAYRFLVDEAGVPSDRLLYYGESLGAAVVVELATEHRPAGLVLRSPFVDLASVGQVHYTYLPVKLLLKDRFPLADQLATLDAPVTVVYGTGDTIVPAEQSRAVAAAAPNLNQLVAVEGADHNDPVLLDGDPLINAVVALADYAGQRP
jgi:fermentation-respiration switch protein FrsA (DUF1100 family)